MTKLLDKHYFEYCGNKMTPWLLTLVAVVAVGLLTNSPVSFVLFSRTGSITRRNLC